MEPIEGREFDVDNATSAVEKILAGEERYDPPEPRNQAEESGDDFEDRRNVEDDEPRRPRQRASKDREDKRPNALDDRTRIYSEVAAKERFVSQERDRYAQGLAQVQQVLNSQMQKDFPEIQNQEDVFLLAEQDPARFAQFQARLMRLQSAQAEAQRVEQERIKSFHAEQEIELERLDPELAPSNPRAAKLIDEIWEFGLREGYSEEQLNLVSARDVKMLKDAMLYRKGRANIPVAKQKAKQAPRVQKPGVASRNTGSSKLKAAAQRLKDEGSVDAAAAFLSAKRNR